MHLKRVLIGLPLVLLLISVIAAYWLLYTGAGASWIWSKVESSDAVTVSSSRTDGNLAGGFNIQELVYRSADIDVFVDHAEIEAGPGLWPPSIQIRTLSLRDISVVRHPQVETQEHGGTGLDISSLVETLQLPLKLEIHDARLTNISLRDDENPPLELISTLRLKATLDEQLSVRQLDITGPRFEAGFHGQLVLESPYEFKLTANGQLDFGREGAAAEWFVPFNLESSGNEQKIFFQLAGLENNLKAEGELLEPFSGPAWDLKGSLNHLDWSFEDGGEALKVSDLTLFSRGSIDDWSIGLESMLAYEGLRDGRFVLSGTGSKTGIRIDEAELAGSGVDLGLSGDLAWSTQARTQLDLVIRQLDFSPWLADWPEGEKLAGGMRLIWSGAGLQISRGNLRLANTELAVDLEADIDIDANSVNAHLEWRDLVWPFRDSSPEFASRSGSLRVNGSVDQWTANGRLDLQVGDYPGGRFDIEGGGERTSARLRIPGGEILGGNVSGEAGIDWMDGIRWDADIKTIQIDPEPLLPGWPGRLDMELVIDAQTQPERYAISLKSLGGLLRGIELNGQGGLVIRGGELSFDRFELSTDEALLWLDGSSAGPDGLTVKFDGYMPSMLLEGASGKLQLEGHYTDHFDQPVFDIQMEAQDFYWKDLGVRALSLNTEEAGSGDLSQMIDLSASGLTWQDQTFDELRLSVKPEREKHKLRVELIHEKFVLDSVMSLVSQNGEGILNGPWNGSIDTVTVSFSQEHILSLLEPASFEWSTEAAQLAPLCLHDQEAAGVCLSGGYQPSGDWSVFADVEAVPVDYLREILELNVHFDQLIDGRLEWHQPRDRAPNGGAKFRITAGRIFEPDDELPLLESSAGEFSFALRNGNLEAGALDIEFPDIGFIDFDFEVLDIMENGARKLNGRAVAQMNDIELFGHLAWPALDEIGGRFESDILLGGNLSDPDFSGGFKLTNGFVRYAPLGVRLDEIDVEGQVEKRDRGQLEGQFRAGEGIGTISGQFLFEDFEKLKMELALSGDRLLLINTDTVQFNTETDLRLGLRPNRVDINGHINVPSARLTPENLILGKVTDSEDLVIEPRDEASQPKADKSADKSRVFGQLEVSFGDDVFIKFPGVETYVNGSVLYKWTGEPIPMASGSYRLKGKVDVYGPTLQIDNGSINFPDIEANNPLLNIRAEREIYGNTQIGAAGVQVIGTLKRPKLEAYTSPLTNEDRAWALLITGSDFDQAQGVSGFDVGTYIAPRLYVSYGVSLFEDENVISARYDLKKGFGLKVTSGQRETGFDLSYTIEKE